MLRTTGENSRCTWFGSGPTLPNDLLIQCSVKQTFALLGSYTCSASERGFWGCGVCACGTNQCVLGSTAHRCSCRISHSDDSSKVLQKTCLDLRSKSLLHLAQVLRCRIETVPLDSGKWSDGVSLILLANLGASLCLKVSRSLSSLRVQANHNELFTLDLRMSLLVCVVM